jgi:hypothetical protein
LVKELARLRARRIGPVETQRVIASAYPHVDLYADLGVPSKDWDVLHEIEGLTNARLRDERGEIPMVLPENRAQGPGASFIMAPFTRPYRSRFSDGSYGIYYCAAREETAIREVAHHRARFMAETRQPPQTLVFRSITAKVEGKGYDVYAANWKWLRRDDWTRCQQFGKEARAKVELLRYESVRDRGHAAYAVFKPRIVRKARPVRFLEMHWDGRAITHWSAIGGNV